jgi:hypothetical protein
MDFISAYMKSVRLRETEVQFCLFTIITFTLEILKVRCNFFSHTSRCVYTNHQILPCVIYITNCIIHNKMWPHISTNYMVICRPLVHIKPKFCTQHKIKYFFHVYEWPEDDHVIGQNVWPCLVMYNTTSCVDDINMYFIVNIILFNKYARPRH